MNKKIQLFIALCAVSVPGLVSASGFNNPPDSNGGQVCHVTTLVDNVAVIGSLRRALEQGYNIQNNSVTFCKQKIVFDISGTIALKKPIVLSNALVASFVFEKGVGVAGDVVLDASQVAATNCALEIGASNVTVRQIKIQNAENAGVCLKSGAKTNLLDRVTVSRSGDGVVVEVGAQGNTIQNGSFFDNAGFGVLLEDASQNTVTQNALFRNGAGAIESPDASIKPEITSAVSNNGAATSFTVFGRVPAPVDRVEIFKATATVTSKRLKKLQNGFQGLGNTFGGVGSFTTTNFLTSVTPDATQTFFTDVTAIAGEKVFAVAIAADGSTSPSTALFQLAVAGSPNPNNPNNPNPNETGERPCVFGQVFPANVDFDQDSIPDVLEDLNKNCLVELNETDPESADTDDDLIPDGVEDRDHNGLFDFGETDPRLADTDQDGISDGAEDLNRNGVRDFGELDAASDDTDTDGLLDFIEDFNRNGFKDENETDGTLIDTDRDGLEDGEEDVNLNGIVDIRETDPTKVDTDGDGAGDGTEVQFGTNPTIASNAHLKRALGASGGCSLVR